MIESIEFTNFKALRKTTLPLAPFTLLLGPNGSGKTTVLQALQDIAVLAAQPIQVFGRTDIPIGVNNKPFTGTPSSIWSAAKSVTTEDPRELAEVKLRIRWDDRTVIAGFRQNPGIVAREVGFDNGTGLHPNETTAVMTWLARMQTYALNPIAVAQPVAVGSGPLQRDGTGLASVLDDLHGNHPERWESLLVEMRRWLPEYDYIHFDSPARGQKGIVLRTRKGGHRIPAQELSQGTLIGLALLTLAYLPSPPSVVGLEEIDRGLHPRLLRHLQDALYRLSNPESCGESRLPVQVIATTHSPYLLDMYREHPEEVVLAKKEGLEVTMQRLTDIENYQEILGDSPLSDVWYSGVLGGVSVKP